MQLSGLLNEIQTQALSITDWDDWAQRVERVFSLPFDSVARAVLLGAQCPLPAYGFASGYQVALFVLYPQANPKQRYAFCVTEPKGNNPKAIETYLQQSPDGWQLHGHKSFITAIDQADVFLVAAEVKGAATDGNKKTIKLVVLEKSTPGITLQPLPELPFVAELSHGAMAMDSVAIGESQILPGDGYEDYVKRFRTIEDIHVSAALLGFWLGLAFRFQWPASAKERLLGVWMQYQGLLAFDFNDSGAHIALAGVLRQQAQCFDELLPQLDTLPEALRNTCIRDRKLEQVASAAREKRLAKAWQHID